MRFSKKRYLITAEQYEKLGKDQHADTPAADSYRIAHPDIKKAREASTKAMNILKSDSISEFDRTLLYGQEFQRYLHNLKKALTTSKEEAYLGNAASSRQTQPPPPPPPSSPPPSPQPTPPTIVATPSHRQRKGRRHSKNTPTSLLTGVAHISTPIIHPSSPLTPPSTSSTRPYGHQRLIEDMAPEDRPRAIKVLEVVKAHPSISWNPRNGTVRIDGRMTRGDNIRGLLADVVANKRQFSSKSPFELVSRLMGE